MIRDRIYDVRGRSESPRRKSCKKKDRDRSPDPYSDSSEDDCTDEEDDDDKIFQERFKKKLEELCLKDPYKGFLKGHPTGTIDAYILDAHSDGGQCNKDFKDQLDEVKELVDLGLISEEKYKPLNDSYYNRVHQSLWKNTLNKPIYIQFFVPHGRCGADTELMDGTGYTDLYRKYQDSIKQYNTDKKYHALMEDLQNYYIQGSDLFMKYSIDPNENPNIQSYVIPGNTNVELPEHDFIGSKDEHYGLLVDTNNNRYEFDKMNLRDLLDKVITHHNKVSSDANCIVIFMGVCRGTGLEQLTADGKIRYGDWDTY